jgi:anti-anti-sigma factor
MVPLLLDARVISVDQDPLYLAQIAQPTLLNISVSWSEDSALMVLAGEVDVSTVPLLEEQLEQIVPGVRIDLIVDLDLVTFLDARGLSFLVTAHRRLASQDARLVVFAPTRQVLRLFDLTGLAPYLVIRPERSAAN